MASAKSGPERIEPGSVNTPLGKFPETKAPRADEDADKISTAIVDKLNEGLSKKDYGAVADLFLDEGYWRDHLASQFDLRTLKGPAAMKNFLGENSTVEKINIERGSEFQAPSFGPLDGVGDPQGITFLVDFTSKLGKGRGIVRLADEGKGWKIFTLFLTLEELAGVEEPTGWNRAQGVRHGGNPDRRSWLERRVDEIDLKDKEPVVMIVGAGQAGLTAAARLKMLGVEAVIVDSNERVGDNWRKRYKQLVLHDPVWYDHMPYVPFPQHWPIFTPKDKLGDWFESYAKTMELAVWMQTAIVSTKWGDKEARWTVELNRTKPDGSKEKRTLHPRHIIQCTGHSGKKNIPQLKGMDNFKGDVLCHSGDHKGAKQDGKGRKAVVVGACNSSHDIAQDFYEKGYDVTMVQRSSTTVVSSYAITDIALKGLYDQSGPPVEESDLWLWGMPSELLKTQQVRVAAIQREYDAETLQGLEKAGFKLDQGPSGGGLFIKYFQRGGGYYIDVGASKLIVDGKIKVKHGHEIDEIQADGILFDDGSKLEADEIVLATGYQNMRTQARAMYGDELADRTSDVWGFDQEGEFRTLYKRSGHPGFWYFGGNLAICRYFSRIVALQIKAQETGLASREPGAVQVK